MKQFTHSVILIASLLTTVAKSAEFESQLISVETQGNGPDLILLHGFASSPNVWSEVVENLESRFRLHIVHVAGLSGMPAPEVSPESYLDAIRDEVIRYIKLKRIKKPTLIGHSMGGLLSLMISSREEADLDRVIIVDALPFFSLIFNPQATSEQVVPQAEAMEKQIVSFNDMQFEYQAKSSVAILTKDKAKKELLLNWSKQSDRKAYAQILREVMAYDARPELKAITRPVAVIHAYDVAMGRSEEQVRRLYQDAYAEVIDVNIEMVAGSYHFIMWDQPEYFLRLLSEMLTN